MDIFEFVLNFFQEVYYQLQLANSPFLSALILIANGLWIPIVIVMLINAKVAWIDWRETVYHINRRKFILLAIDIPRDNDQSPKAVENIFTHLYGILLSRNNQYEKWWEGRHQDYFSMELVSIEGYVQFIVYTMEEYRDIVESAFYSQYPDAEITQVEDYVYGQNGEFKDVEFPSDKYDIWGTEFILTKHNAYSLRLYRDFEHSLSQELKDPMASLLENMNKIGPGEQMWIQWVITPEYDTDWQDPANRVAMAIAGKSMDTPQNSADKFIGRIILWIDATANAIFPFYKRGDETEKQKDDMPSLMLHLTPAEQSQLEGIQLKADKPGFWTKMRYVYIGETESMSKARGVNPIVGSIRQFDSLNQNSFRMHKYTKTSGIDYVFTVSRMARRKNNILRAFQNRSRSMGSSGMILNVEELATVYHFPTETVKAPMVARTQSKRSSAPISLPIEGAPRTLREAVAQNSGSSTPQTTETQPPASHKTSNGSTATPGNLPFIE